jgi:hypothetical protein
LLQLSVKTNNLNSCPPQIKVKNIVKWWAMYVNLS